MRKPMKIAALLLAACLACLGLTGCHGDRGLSAFSMPDSFDESRDYEITFWAKNDTNKTQVAVYQQAIADFEKAYPNIHVNLRLYTNYGDIYNDVITNIATGTTPNVCITYPDHIATYLTGSNVVAPLDELMADEGYGLGGTQVKFDSLSREEIVPQFLQEGSFGGHVYAMPFMRSTEATYVNVDYVEQLGFELPEVLTWDFMWEVAETATAKNDDGTYKINGQKVMIPVIYKSTDNMMIQLLRQTGGGYSTDDGEILLFNDATREILRTVAEHAKTGAFSTFKISSYPANFLNAGQCIFAIDSTAGATWMGTDAPLCDISEDKIVSFRTRVYPVPQADPDQMQMISQGPSVCVFNKEDPQEVLASWLLVQFLLTDGVQIPYAETEGYVPVTLRAQESQAYQEYLSEAGKDAEHYQVKIDATNLLLSHTEDTFVTPVFNGSASLRDAAGQLIESTTKSVRRKQTVDDAFIEKLFADTASLYHLDQLQAQGGLGGGGDLGPLPGLSVGLLACLGGIWVLLLAKWLVDAIKMKKLQNKG